MIEIKKLSKVYKINKGEDCVALKNISITLPDTGMVFIVGKSGSGKSTLLNLIGGLDSVTKGKIIADGNDLTKLTPKQFDDYRSSYLTFVFQDYKLFDGLTVKENVEVGLDITNSLDDNIVNTSIKKVGLDGYQDRYPYELSGGQCQRVAIARALSRNSKLILADEPTGNLDKNTSRQILNILKKISTKKLVVIVSHNLVDADLYADRIIELHDGNIISDQIKNDGYENSFKIEDEVCYLPHYKDITKDEANSLLEGLQNGKIREVVQNDNGFTKIDDSYEVDSRKVPLTSRSATNKSLFKILKLFFTSKIYNKIMVIVFSVLLFAVLAILHSFISFTPTLDKIDNDKDYYVLNKGDYIPFDSSLYVAPIHEVTLADVQYFLKTGYEGEIYKINNYVIPIVSGTNNIGNKYTIAVHNNLGGFYAKTTYGTLVCDEKYLAKYYPNEKGKLNVLAGDVDMRKYGIVITDYIADAMMYHGVYDDYMDMVGLQNVNGTPFYINAVIDTGYRDRYRELIDLYLEISDENELREKLIQSDLYEDYIDEAMSFLAVTYSFNPNFRDYIVMSNMINTDSFSNLDFSNNGHTYNSSQTPTTISSDYNYSKDLEKGDIIMSASLYNSIFNTFYTASDYNLEVNNKVTLQFYTYFKGDKLITYEKEFNIIALSSDTYVDKSDFDELLKNQIIDYGLYFENDSNAKQILQVGTHYGYYVKSIDVDSGLAINKMISSFEVLFVIIIIGMYVVLYGYIALYAYNYVKANKEHIGIYNAFGGKIKNIIKVISVDILITGVIICLLSAATMPLFIMLADDVILSSCENLLGIGFYDMSIIKYYPNFLSLNYLILVLCTFLFSIIPTLILFKLKPIEIIRTSE